MFQPKSFSESWREAVRGYSLAMELISACLMLLAFPAVGYWIDLQCETVCVGLILGLICGFVGCGIRVVQIVRLVISGASSKKLPQKFSSQKDSPPKISSSQNTDGE